MMWDYLHFPAHVELPEELQKIVRFLEDCPHSKFHSRMMALKLRFYNKSDEFTALSLFYNATKEAIDQLTEGRFNGFGTHQEMHALGYLIKKCLSHLTTGYNTDSPQQIFWEHIRLQISLLEATFQPLFDVLTMNCNNLTKREKRLLIRAYYPKFQKTWGSFPKIIDEYCYIYEQYVILIERIIYDPNLGALLKPYQISPPKVIEVNWTGNNTNEGSQ